MRKIIDRFEMQNLSLCVQDSLLLMFLINGVFVAGGKNRNTASICNLSPLTFSHRTPVLETQN